MHIIYVQIMARGPFAMSHCGDDQNLFLRHLWRKLINFPFLPVVVVVFFLFCFDSFSFNKYYYNVFFKSFLPENVRFSIKRACHRQQAWIVKTISKNISAGHYFFVTEIKWWWSHKFLTHSDVMLVQCSREAVNCNKQWKSRDSLIIS